MDNRSFDRSMMRREDSLETLGWRDILGSLDRVHTYSASRHFLCGTPPPVFLRSLRCIVFYSGGRSLLSRRV
jgi:hypothetical protein